MSRRLTAWALIVCIPTLLSACSSRGGIGTPSPAPAEPPAASATPPSTAPPAPPTLESGRAAAPERDDCALGVPTEAVEPAPSNGSPVTTIGVTDRIDPAHAPRPTNDSEHLLFAQVYETLVRANCNGRVVPGLAASWRLDADRRTWFLTLRDEARFADGTPVTPAEVRASWTGDGADGALRPEVARLVESVAESGDRTLAIRLRNPGVDMPLPLAHRDLAIARPAADSAWPLGTRAGLVVHGFTGSAVTLTRDDVEVMRILSAPVDPRDLLDRGVDLLLTRNPTALAYAATQPAFQELPLAWHHTYVLLTPGRARGLRQLSDGLREALAGEAVRGDARGAQGPFWWQMPATCDIAHASPATADAGAAAQQPLRTPRVVYDADDEVARDLAERFVGLVRASGPGAAPFLDVLLPDRPRRTYQRAAGLTRVAFERAQRVGTDAGYVVAVANHPLDPCRDLRMLTADAPWLDPETIVPLVDTRLYAIVRPGRAALTAEWDGTVLVAAGDPARDRAGRAR